MIVAGKATMYRTLLVKLKSRKRLPTKAQASDAMLSSMHLAGPVSAAADKCLMYATIPMRILDAGSSIVCHGPSNCQRSSPGHHQCCNREHICHGRERSRDEGNSGRSKPPVTVASISPKVVRKTLQHSRRIIIVHRP